MSLRPVHLVDVAVVGLGVHGSALTAELAGRGAAVVGIERSAPQDVTGSSGAPVRMIQARGPRGPLDEDAARSLVDAWFDLLDRAGDGEALVPRRAVAVSAVVGGTSTEPGPIKAVAWSSRRESPGHLVHAARAVRALRALATRRGAALLHSEPVGFTSVLGRHPEHVVIHTEDGMVHAQTVVFCVGQEVTTLPPSLRPAGLRVEPALTLVAVFAGHPVHDIDAYYLLDRPEGEFCLLPVPGTDRVQAGHFRSLAATRGREPGGWRDATARAGEAALVRHLGARPARDAVRQVVGHYTHTASGRFELVRAGPRVSALTACAGTGFKFAPQVAARIADVLLGDTDAAVDPLLVDPLLVDYRSTDPWT